MEHDVRTRVWRGGSVETDGFPFDQISDYLEEPDCLVWVDVCAPDRSRLNALAGALSLDPHAVEDAVEKRERPKASRYATHMFLAAYDVSFDRDAGQLRAHQVAAFVLRNALVTVRQSEDVDMDRVVAVWDENADLMKFGSKALVHGLLDVLVDRHFAAIEALDDEIEKIEDILFEETRESVREVQRRSYALRKALVEARRVILPMREVVNAVMRRADDAHPELEPYYDDLYDHVLRAAEWTESLRDLRNQSVTRRLTAEHDHEEADGLGGDHRGADGDYRLLRAERSISRLRYALGVLGQHHDHDYDRGRAVRGLPPQGLDLSLTQSRGLAYYHLVILDLRSLFSPKSKIIALAWPLLLSAELSG
jgi:magnesium transporter